MWYPINLKVLLFPFKLLIVGIKANVAYTREHINVYKSIQKHKTKKMLNK